ncbi:hypothetical protein KL951_002559 [Ogataea haglerorum]|nr:hypothetical protein KL951_002559 [Ogataea haglerorum]
MGTSAMRDMAELPARSDGAPFFDMPQRWQRSDEWNSGPKIAAKEPNDGWCASRYWQRRGKDRKSISAWQTRNSGRDNNIQRPRIHQTRHRNAHGDRRMP